MEFKKFKQALQKHFNEMVFGADRLYEVDIDKDALWNLYLDSFPAGTNEVYRERRGTRLLLLPPVYPGNRKRGSD